MNKRDDKEHVINTVMLTMVIIWLYAHLTRLFAAIHFVDTRLFIRNIEMITSCLSNAHGNHIAEQKREPAQNRLVIVAV